MKINLLLFGPLAQRMGKPQVTLDVPGDAATSTQVREALAQAAPQLATSLPACRLAVNHAYIGEDEPITAEDEVALIGMVNGG